MSEAKDPNPKDAVGCAKAPMSTLSGPVIMEVGLATMEGARKYGRHNWRASPVKASIYYDAALRHMIAWYEGEDVDPDSGLSHIAKAMAGLHILRDAQIRDTLVDDRPPGTIDFIGELNIKAAEIIERYPECLPAITHRDADAVLYEE